MDFQENIELTLKEIKEEGHSIDARKLNERNGFDESHPQFFTGDLKSKFVVVHLNPKSNEETEERNFSNSEEYFAYWQNFGTHRYGNEYRTANKKRKMSSFDKKQYSFFMQEELGNSDSDWNKMERFINRKLQLEIIPFASKSFDSKKLQNDIFVKEAFNRVLSEIASEERAVIIFCGVIFKELIKSYGGIELPNSFRKKLPVANEKESKIDYEKIIYKITVDNKEIKVIVAPQFALQNGMQKKYSEMFTDESKAIRKIINERNR